MGYFNSASLTFLKGLKRHNEKSWFEAHREDWQLAIHQPMVGLVEEMDLRFARFAPEIAGDPRRSIFRIHRDIRFSKDKSPYKTHVAGLIPLTAKKPVEGGCSALYAHFGIDEEWVGNGTYFFDDKQLQKWRKLVAADKTGQAIAGIIAKLRKRGYVVGGHDDYKKVPKGYAPDHPRAELLKMRGLTAGFPAIPRGMLHQAKLADWLVDHGNATAPMVVWLHEHVK